MNIDGIVTLIVVLAVATYAKYILNYSSKDFIKFLFEEFRLLAQLKVKPESINALWVTIGSLILISALIIPKFESLLKINQLGGVASIGISSYFAAAVLIFMATNISQFLLGGGKKGYAENQRLQSQATRRNIVGFMDWLLSGNSGFTSIPSSYMTHVSRHNKQIAKNIYLIAGDSFLESLSLALNFATMNPGNVNAWAEYVTAIRRLCDAELAKTDYEEMTVFIDCNPSFSVYTQMALVSSDNIIIPVMADYSSLEGIKGIMMLLYGKYPSSAAKNYADKVLTFNKQVQAFKLSLPKIFELPFNNFTANMGVANAYASIKNEISDFAWQQYQADSSVFANLTAPATSKAEWEDIFMSNVKDFHTSGKVSASLGIPLHKLPMHTNYTMPDGTEVNIPKDNYKESLDHLRLFVKKL